MICGVHEGLAHGCLAVKMTQDDPRCLVLQTCTTSHTDVGMDGVKLVQRSLHLLEPVPELREADVQFGRQTREALLKLGLPVRIGGKQARF